MYVYATIKDTTISDEHKIILSETFNAVRQKREFYLPRIGETVQLFSDDIPINFKVIDIIYKTKYHKEVFSNTENYQEECAINIILEKIVK